MKSAVLVGAVVGATLVAGTQATGAGVAQAAAPRVSGTAFTAAPMTSPYVIAFQDRSGTLGQNGNLYSPGSLGLSVAPGTSPVVVPQPGFNYEIVYQASDHHWAETGDAGTLETSFVMAPGTSPAAVLSPGASNGAWQNAWQGSNGNLWAQGTDLGLPMAPNTSPSMAWLDTGYQILYQASNHHLAQTGVFGTRDLGAVMAPGSSPTVTLSPGAFGAYQIAWTGDNGDLWASDPIGGATTDLGLRPAPNSSPSITVL